MSDDPKLLTGIRLHITRAEFIVGIVCTILGFFIHSGFDYYKEKQQTKEKMLAERVIAFIDTTREFDALAATLAHGIMDRNAPDLDARSKLISNLTEQYSEVNELEPILKENRSLAENYKNAILQTNKELPSITEITELKRYWESMSRLLKARKELATQLRRSASLTID